MTDRGRSDSVSVPTYEDLRALVRQLVAAGDVLAELLEEPLSTEEEHKSALARWEGALASAARALEGSRVGR